MDAVQTAAEAQVRIGELSAAAWLLASVGIALELNLPVALAGEARYAPSSGGERHEPLSGAVADAMVAAGLARRTKRGVVAAKGLRQLQRETPKVVLQALLRTELLQISAVFSRAMRGDPPLEWVHTDPDLLTAQGTASAGAADALQHDILPRMEGVVERLNSGAGILLDVGAGVGAVAIALCERFPKLRVVALEPSPFALDLAERNVAQAGFSDRIELRATRIEELQQEERFDVVWLPGNFLAPAVLPDAFRAAYRALRPGGYVLPGSFAAAGDDPPAVVARLRSVTWSGDVASPQLVVRLLEAAGFEDVRCADAPGTGVVPMRARRPARPQAVTITASSS